MDYLLAIDQGTHASRAVLFDRHGRKIGSQLVPVRLRQPRANHTEQDPGEILDSVRNAVEHTIQALPAAGRGNICACGLTTQRSTVLAWQANGAPLSAAISWQDTRGAPLVSTLRAHAADIRKQTGLPLSAHYGASKLHWLHQLLIDEPELRLGPLASFLLYHLTGSGHAIDHSNAQRMQLLDIGSLNWSRQLAEWFGLTLNGLPECRPVLGDYGRLADYDIPITAVCGDQNAAWHSHGKDTSACALINLGSGAFVLAAQPAGVDVAELLRSLSVSDAQGAEWLMEGTVNGAGNALQWLAEQDSIDKLFERLPGWLSEISNPPLFLNSIGGLGSPWWRQLAVSTFIPDNTTHTPTERAVAVAESIVFLVQYNLERMMRYTPIDHLRVSGGLSQLDGLCQKFTNLSGLPVERCDDPEASARGVAWLAAGRPSDWYPMTGTADFFPQTDTALQDRYRAVINLLQQHIENSNGN